MLCDPRPVPSLSEPQISHLHKGISCVPITGCCESSEGKTPCPVQPRVWHTVTTQYLGTFNTHEGSVALSHQRGHGSGPPFMVDRTSTNSAHNKMHPDVRVPDSPTAASGVRELCRARPTSASFGHTRKRPLVRL